MAQTPDQLVKWLVAELPRLRARLAMTHAAIARARDVLGDRRAGE